MTINDIIGQEEVKAILKTMVNNSRIPHAQIFLGAEGSGNLAMALAFAQAVMCTNPIDGDACGTCSSCHKASKFIHPDIHFSFPTVGSKVTSSQFGKEWRSAISENAYFNAHQWLQILGAENKQGNITKDECTEIIKKLSLKIFEGKYKILLMWLPEYLGKEGNRLLKLIEEPPENTLFILVAENSEEILNTILSRCQIIQFKPLSDEEIVNQLVLEKNIESTKANELAHLSNGNYNAALSLLKETNSDNNAQLFVQWLRICYQNQAKSLIEWSSEFAKWGRENQKHFLDYGLFFLREYMLLLLTQNKSKIRLREKELQTAVNLQKVISYRQIEPISNIINDSAFHISRNANPKILMTNISLQIHHCLKNN